MNYFIAQSPYNQAGDVPTFRCLIVHTVRIELIGDANKVACPLPGSNPGEANWDHAYRAQL